MKFFFLWSKTYRLIKSSSNKSSKIDFLPTLDVRLQQPDYWLLVTEYRRNSHIYRHSCTRCTGTIHSLRLIPGRKEDFFDPSNTRTGTPTTPEFYSMRGCSGESFTLRPSGDRRSAPRNTTSTDGESERSQLLPGEVRTVTCISVKEEEWQMYSPAPFLP